MVIFLFNYIGTLIFQRLVQWYNNNNKFHDINTNEHTFSIHLIVVQFQSHAIVDLVVLEGDVVFVYSVPFLNPDLFRTRTRLSCDQFLQITYRIIFIAFYTNFLTQTVITDYFDHGVFVRRRRRRFYEMSFFFFSEKKNEISMCIKKNINVNLNLSRLTSMVERIFTLKKKVYAQL